MTSDRARELAQRLVDHADELLLEPIEWDEGVPAGRRRRRLISSVGLRGWVTRPAGALFLNAIVVSLITQAVLAGLSDGPPEPGGFGPVLLRIVASWVLAFGPAYIFVRFLGERIPSIWNEYVLRLYRLGLDRPENLPRPPLASPYYESWRAAGGKVGSQKNIYREKFDAIYGPSASASGVDRLHRVRVETLVPVFLLTTLLAACWTALLWDVRILDLNADDRLFWKCLAFGFLGAYIFGLQTLVRRDFQNDLRASTYANLVLRIVIGLLLVAGGQVLLEHLGADAPTQALASFAFGFLWLSLVHATQRLTVLLLRLAVPSVRPTYPLTALDGMSVWYEARLQEEGVEDMQNLVTANLVDLLLRTRIPTGRLIDWMDQSLLLLHAGRIEEGLATKFRQIGVTTATDLLALFPSEGMDDSTMLRTLADLGLDPTTVRSLSRVLAREAAMNPIRNWKDGRPGHPNGPIHPTTTPSATS